MKFRKNISVIVLSILLVVSVTANILAYQHYKNLYTPKFTLISPNIAWMDTNQFLESQKKYSVHYQGLKSQILTYINGSGATGNYGIYFEDLNTGAWIGINERDEFIPASLLKVPIMVAILKKVEIGELDINQVVALRQEDLDLKSGTLGLKGAGYEITVRELLTDMIKESDNTAVLTLRRFLDDTDINQAKLAMGLPTNDANFGSIGPKHYSNVLRSLYYSAYLRRTFSELGLSIMSETEYNTQIPAGVPNNIHISHKIGFFYNSDGTAGYHDCGIIYYPNKPYILCVMSKNTNKEEADKIISDISKIIYDYTDNTFGSDTENN